MADVRDHADHLGPGVDEALILPPSVDADLFAYARASGPRATSQHLVDQHHRASAIVVALVEQAPGDQTRADRRQIAGRDQPRIGFEGHLGAAGRIAQGIGGRPVRDVVERQLVDRARRLDPGSRPTSRSRSRASPVSAVADP